MKKVVLHHTCSQENGEASVLENAPFLAEDNPQNRKYQFLGAGYYLWEDDIEQAKLWGKVHYKNSYFVVEFECDIEEEDILNLNEREGQKALFEMIENIQTELEVNLRRLPLSRIFSLIYKSDITFNYKTIKVKDEFSSRKRQEAFKFTSVKDNFTYLGGVYFYFFKNKIDFVSKKILQL